MREHEAYETFCRYCLRKFESPTLEKSVRDVQEHERECWKAAKK